MMRIAALLALLLLGSCQSTNQLQPSENLIKQHMSILAADDMEGREAGTPGYDKAAAYVAEEFAKLGLLPAGEDGTYFQNVPMRRSYRETENLFLEANRPDGSRLNLQDGVDFAVYGSKLHAKSSISAGVVFAGYGLVAPELDRDDYRGLDVDGKIVALLSGTPGGIQSEERAYYGSQKAVEASKRGAIGIVFLATPQAERRYSFERLVTEGRLDSASMGWINEAGETHTRSPNIQAGATLSLPGAAKLFANAPASWDEVIAAAESGDGKTPTFAMPITMTIKQTSRFDELNSANLLGLMPGSDPVLSNEVIVLSAHLDGIGISNTDEQDRINNGALDNVAGIATLFETARMLAKLDRPKRTLVFFANTAEEKGLLGAEYFVRNQTLGDRTIVGNINLDMPVLTYDFQDVVVFGGNRSSIRDAVASAVDEMGLVLAEDPFPEQGVFTRSDHFRFVEAGIPAVMLATGMANGGQDAWVEHFAKHYHRPSDDMNNNINFQAAARFAELKTRIAMAVANAAARPLWNKDDFFARQFHGPMIE